ncbi:MAG: hypothetical protein R6U96_04725 [Promethearchaeia archaeon]
MAIKARILNEERKKEWQETLGTDTINVQSPVPSYHKVCGKKRLVYWMDMRKLTEKQKEKMIIHIAQKFEETIKAADDFTHDTVEEYVRQNIDTFAVPVLADDVIVSMNASILF